LTRPLRFEFPGAIWHITSRGNERRDIYRDDDDRRRFLSLLAHVVRHRLWRLHAWVLMSNHFHLLIETPEVGLSRGVKWLNQIYAQYFNERYERVGHLFQGRFKGILVEREGHLLELLRYIVLNPVRAGIVKFTGEYAWSNYRATAGLARIPNWLEVDWTLEQFGRNRAEACEAYRRFVSDARGASYNPWEKTVGQIYLGSEEFCDRMQSLVHGKERSFEHARCGLDVLVEVVASTFEVTADDLKEKSRGPARKALTHLAVDDAGLTLRQIAEWMAATEGAASKMRQSSKEMYAIDADYKRQIDRIRAELS
jgi:Transposase and inactivated derivatives